MQGSLDTPPIIVRTSRRISSVGLVTCSIVLYLSLISVIRFGWAPPAAFGLAYFAWQLIDPMTLRLAPDGLTWGNTFGSRFWSWAEIGNFRISFGFVGCDLFDRNLAMGWLRPINATVSGSHGVLGFGWEVKSVELVKLLSAARSRWL